MDQPKSDVAEPKELLPWTLPFPREEWELTPTVVQLFVVAQQRSIEALTKRIEELEARLNRNSSNSNQPPSSDSPYQKPTAEPEKKGKPGAKKGRKGHRQKLFDTADIRDIHPDRCACGCSEFENLTPYYTHQHIELPEILMLVIHFVLYKGRCQSCGKINKGYVPKEYATGYGPRLCALIVELAGMAGNSREMVQTFCSSVLDLSISLGAIQKVIDRVSNAIKPHYEAIANKARASKVNHLDETPWYKAGALNWLWVMTNSVVAFFMIHTNRSKQAFEELIGFWTGILVSDNYGVYRKWVHKRQTCLAHLIRKAKALAERADPELCAFGTWARKELVRLIKMAKAPPTIGEWRAFYARLCRLIALYRDCKSEAGTFACRLEQEMDTLFLFLIEQGVEPTNNFAERMIRFGIL